MKSFNQLQFIKKLLACSPRQLKGESRAGDIIAKTLALNNIPFIVQKFNVYVPKTELAKLIADGKKIDCMATSFVSGKIYGKEKIISSMYNFDVDEPDSPNINFNPYCIGLSCVTHYFAPAITIHPKDILKIVKAKKISGEVKITKTIHESRNFLVGDIKNPKNIFFTHYDCLNLGAIDNASGVSVLMATCITKPDILENNLVVFAGAEELSYDKPTYWAHGYREFEKKYFSLMKYAKKIICVDSVGADVPKISHDPQFLHQAFPIANAKKFKKKIIGIFGDIQKLLPVYHSDLDTIHNLHVKYLQKTTKVILQIAYK